MNGMVLVFHKEEDGELFEKIIIALKARYKLVSLEQLEDIITRKKTTKNICHISFDDGEQSFYTTVFPLLKKHQAPASLFVSPTVITSNVNYWFQEIQGYDKTILKSILSEYLNIPMNKLNKFTVSSLLKSLPFHSISTIVELYSRQTGCQKKVPQNMNADQLRTIDESGLVAIGAHTLNHPVLANENDDDCDHEISQSIKMLEGLLGHPVKYFAYPNGRPRIDFGEREMTYLRKNNISLAFSTALDNLHATTDSLNVPRMGFARMGLSPSNPLIFFRLNIGRRWINIKSLWRTSERKLRTRIRSIIKNTINRSAD